MKQKILIPLIAIVLVGVIIIAFVFWIIPHVPLPLPPSERKAIIIGSANDFYASEAEDDFNTGNQYRKY